MKTPNDIYHGDEHLEEETRKPIKREIVQWKIIAVWDDGSTDDISDYIVVDDSFEDQLTDLENEWEAKAVWGYETTANPYEEPSDDDLISKWGANDA
jgi:hypothetical protein